MLVGTDVLSFGMLQVYRSPQDFPVSDQEKPVETLHPDFVIKKFLESRIYLNTHFSETPPPPRRCVITITSLWLYHSQAAMFNEILLICVQFSKSKGISNSH